MNPFYDGDFMKFIGTKESPFDVAPNINYLFEKLDDFKGDFESFRNYFKKWCTSIKIESDDITDPVVVSGWTLTPEDSGKDYMSISMHLHMKDFDSHKWTKETWRRFKFIFCHVFSHELIHVRQAQNNNLSFNDSFVAFKEHKDEDKNYDRNYHSIKEEIEAYGHCMYMESLWYQCKYNDFKKRLTRTPTYVMLLGVYGGDHTADVVRLHKSQAIKWKLKYEKEN